MTVFGLEVTLICDEPTTTTLVPWMIEARERLFERVFPVLRRSGIHLTVVLLLRERADDAGFNEQSYIDYSPLEGGPTRPTRIILFAGPIPESSKATTAGGLTQVAVSASTERVGR